MKIYYHVSESHLMYVNDFCIEIKWSKKITYIQLMWNRVEDFDGNLTYFSIKTINK